MDCKSIYIYITHRILGFTHNQKDASLICIFIEKQINTTIRSASSIGFEDRIPTRGLP